LKAVMLSEEICRQYEPFIRGKTRNMMTGSRADWEDVVGDVYLSLCGAVNKNVFRGDCDVGTLIFVIIQRRVTDFIRLKYKRADVMERLTSLFQEKFFPSPEEIFVQKEHREMLLGFISRLVSLRQRQILELYLLGDSLSEISRILNVSPGFIHDCFYKAVGHFRKFMKGGLK